MKKVNEQTLSNYITKCQLMQEQLAGKKMQIYQCAKNYGGNYYLYEILQKDGYLIKNDDGHVKWHGDIPTEKEMKVIIRKVNTISRRSVGKVRKYRKSGKYSKVTITTTPSGDKWRVIKDTVAAMTTTVNPTTTLILGAIESEIAAHRSNGQDKTHVNNIAILARDLVKVAE